MQRANKVPRVTELVVNNDLCIGCGLCVYKCPNKAIEMHWNELGFLEPELSGDCNACEACVTVCPFNPFPALEVKTENELAGLFLKDANLFNQEVGKYRSIHVGYAEEFRLTSSSGGVATFVLTDLLDRGIVDHVFSVKESKVKGVHYEYSISSNRAELIAASKTRYYPVTLSDVLSKIGDIQGRVAIVGVACFIKAIRLAQYQDQSLLEKIPFLVGIICGGVKSNFFTEYLSDKAGVQASLCQKPEFRIKDFDSTALDYSFGCIDCSNNQKKTIKMQSVGDLWGTGLFKSNACDFCDDVSTELADISLGDAWVEPFFSEGKGTNVVIVRSKIAEAIINEGVIGGKLHFDNMSLDKFIFSQQGSYNHRHAGLFYRISIANKKNRLVPPKRLQQKTNLTFLLKLIQLGRMKTREKSLRIWRTTRSAQKFDAEMKKSLYLLSILTRLNRYVKKLSNKFSKTIVFMK